MTHFLRLRPLCEDAEIVPIKESNIQMQAGNSSASKSGDSDIEIDDGKPGLAPKPPAGNRTCKVSVKDLPKESVISKVDPYFKLYVDGFHVYGNRDIAQSNKKDADWSFQIPQARLWLVGVKQIDFL